MKAKWDRFRANPRDAILTIISGLIWVWFLRHFPVIAWSIFGLMMTAGLYVALTHHK